MKKIDKKAFTLIELIVVVAIIGILVLLATPRLLGHAQRAELAKIQHDVKAMEKEIGAEFINGDDDSNKWKSNRKDLNQLVQENKLFEKEGVVKKIEVFSIGETYKVTPENYEAKINTKLKGTFYVDSGGKVYYEHTKPLVGISAELEYSDKEIEDLIAEGYIPIATADELNSIRVNNTRTYGEGTEWEDKYTGGLDKKYVQVANIDLSVYSEGEGWTPIGTSSARFRGAYDGGNYVITGLEVNGEGKNYQGLFGHAHVATISNVALEDIKVTGNESVGGLVGWASHSTIENSYVTGSVTGNESVGGLVGYAGYSTTSGTSPNTTISNSYATGSVSGTGNYVGGLVGKVFNRSKIRNSYVTGSVEGTGSYVGGLVGYASSSSEISNSYTKGSVEGKGYVGGLVGYAYSLTTISNSYSTGSVTGANNVGGFVGYAYGSTNISNSYTTGKVTGDTQVGGLVGSASSNIIENSYATGSVEGSEKVGGLVGYTGTSSTISNSYATGPVNGSERVGGLVGHVYHHSKISNSYATGSVTGNESAGGLVGYNDYGTVTNSYWDTVTTGQSTSARGIGKSTDEMKLKETYTDWGFDTVWKIDEGVSYPTLISNPERH